MPLHLQFYDLMVVKFGDCRFYKLTSSSLMVRQLSMLLRILPLGIEPLDIPKNLLGRGQILEDKVNDMYLNKLDN